VIRATTPTRGAKKVSELMFAPVLNHIMGIRDIASSSRPWSFRCVDALCDGGDGQRS
jgi:hypothetical protein